MKNRRGDIPITILVIGVIAVCILTLFSFWYLQDKKNKTFVGAGLIETIYSVQEENKLNTFPSFQEQNIFKKNNVEINFNENKINAKYVSGEKVLVEIEYTPIE